MKKSIIITTLIVLILIAAGSYFAFGNSTSPSISANVISTDSLAKHNSASDCWVAFQGKVYDITAFLPNHPGGAGAIIPTCGTSDGFTKAFTTKHGTTKIAMLMKVGVLMGDFQIVGTTK